MAESTSDHRLFIRRDEVTPIWRCADIFDLRVPDGPLLLIDHFRLLQRLSVRAGDETYQLSRRPLAVGTNDFVVETLADAVDIQDAMRRVARAYNFLHGGHYNRVEIREDRLIYIIDDRDFPYTFPPDSGPAFATLEGVLIFLHAMLSLAAGLDLSPMLRRVRTRRVNRHGPDGLLSFWPAEVRSGAAYYALEYDTKKTAGLPVSLTRKAGHAIDVYAAIETMIRSREDAGRPMGFVERVQDAIAAGIEDQENAARHLGVSVATLRRRLSQSGSRFRDLRARGLNDRARQMLNSRRHPDDIAEALGFSDARSFARAFKSWNGVTPSCWVTTVSEFVLND